MAVGGGVGVVTDAPSASLVVGGILAAVALFAVREDRTRERAPSRRRSSPARPRARTSGSAVPAARATSSKSAPRSKNRQLNATHSWIWRVGSSAVAVGLPSGRKAGDDDGHRGYPSASGASSNSGSSTTLSCSFGSVRASTATQGSSALALSGRCGTPAGM